MTNYDLSTKEAKLGWNWGAFMMPLQFGMGNKAYLAFLALIPVLSIIWIFVTGSQGAKWAFESGAFANIDEFNGAMESWNRAGKIMAIICAVIIVFYIAIIVALGNFVASIF